MPAPQRPFHVALISTAALDDKGSMRAYADTLLAALARHAPEIRVELVELDPAPARGVWSQRLQTILLPVRAWSQRRRAPDLWHVLDGSRGFVARALGNAPVMATVHDIIPWLQADGRFPGVPRLGMMARRLWRANGSGFRSCQSLVCDSSSTAIDVRRAFGIEADRCTVVFLPLRPTMDRCARVSDTVRAAGSILHVGNNGFYKNREGVLRIFSKLDSQVANRLVLAGPEPTADLLRIAHELGIPDRIEWSCDPDDDTLARHYRQSSVLLFPSLYEGFGWPVLEAMAFGLPVVVSNAGSLPEVVGDAATGLSLDDEHGFVSAVERLLSSPEIARVASERGLVRAQEFGSAAFADSMRRAYLLAIENGRSSETA